VAETDTQQTFFGVEKIYLKDVSYEAPGAPGVFLQSKQPEIGVQLVLEHRSLDEQPGFYEVTVTVQINAKADDKSMFLVEVQQAGVFRVQGVSGDLLERTLEISCAYMLLPFAREAVNDLVCKGGFPQLLINPINFDMLYEQKHAAARAPAEGKA